MESPDTFKFCRVCLVPDEALEFNSIFDNNAKMAKALYQIAGIILMEIDQNFPSLICGKCVSEIQAVDALKMRILDADEYYSMMTLESEKRFLDVDMKQLINVSTKTPQNKKKKPNVRNMTPKAIESDFMKIKIKQEPIDESENVNPRKRKLEQDTELTPKAATKSFLPKATPNKFGIHRMIIKGKKTKPGVNNRSTLKPQISTPVASSKSKNSFLPKLNLSKSAKSKKKSSSTGESKRITFECDNCKNTFETYQALNDHLIEHDFIEPFTCSLCDATFANEEYLKVHTNARH